MKVIKYLALTVLLAFASSTLEAYGDRCDAFYEGFVDGYCMHLQWTCYPPVGPVCVDLDYRNPNEAYHKGLVEGQLRWRRDYGIGNKV